MKLAKTLKRPQGTVMKILTKDEHESILSDMHRGYDWDSSDLRDYEKDCLRLVEDRAALLALVQDMANAYKEELEFHRTSDEDDPSHPSNVLLERVRAALNGDS